MFELIKDMIINLYHSEQPYVLLLNVLVFVALIVFVLSLTKYWSDHNVMQKFIAKVRADAKEQERLREEEYRKQFEMNGRFEAKDKMLKLNQKISSQNYSRKHFCYPVRLVSDLSLSRWLCLIFRQSEHLQPDFCWFLLLCLHSKV